MDSLHFCLEVFRLWCILHVSISAMHLSFSLVTKRAQVENEAKCEHYFAVGNLPLWPLNAICRLFANAYATKLKTGRVERDDKCTCTANAAINIADCVYHATVRSNTSTYLPYFSRVGRSCFNKSVWIIFSLLSASVLPVRKKSDKAGFAGCFVVCCDYFPSSRAPSSATLSQVWSRVCGDDSTSGRIAAGADYVRGVENWGGPLRREENVCFRLLIGSCSKLPVRPGLLWFYMTRNNMSWSHQMRSGSPVGRTRMGFDRVAGVLFDVFDDWESYKNLVDGKLSVFAEASLRVAQKKSRDRVAVFSLGVF